MNKNASFMGFETWLTNLKMTLKMQACIFASLAIVQIGAIVVIAAVSFTDDQKSVIKTYAMSLAAINENSKIKIEANGRSYYQTASYVRRVYRPYVASCAEAFVNKAAWTFCAYILWIPIGYFFRKRARAQGTSERIRGARLATAAELKSLTMKEKTFLDFGEVKMPVSAETKHALIIGRPGVGKTVCISRLLEQIARRGDRAVIHDFKGDYVQKFYRPGRDAIFNPMDGRSAKWNFFDELESPVDVEAAGYALIPEPSSSAQDPFWTNAARDVFAGAANYLIRTGEKNCRALYSLLTSPVAELTEVLKNTPGSEAGAAAVSDPESKQTASVMSVLLQHAKIFSYMAENRRTGGSFSVKSWLENENGGNLYVTNYSTFQDALAPVLTLMVDLLGRKLLSMPDDPDRRIFFMLDEFGALKKMRAVTRLLTLARSKGGAVIIGIQDLGQIDKIYGKEHRQTIVNACGSGAVFSVADADTAETLSRKYGEYLSIESFVASSMGSENGRDGMTINRQTNKERIVLPSEISSLPDLNCYVNFPGYPPAKTVLQYRSYKNVNEPFEERKGFSYDDILKEERGRENELWNKIPKVGTDVRNDTE